MNKKNKKRKKRSQKWRQKKRSSCISLGKTIEWIYRQHPDGVFWFIDVVDELGEKTWYYVHRSQKMNVLDGDRVKAILKLYKGRKEAEIVSITKRAKRVVVWTLHYMKGKSSALVQVANKNIMMDIFVSKQYFWGAKDGDVVGVEIIDWSWKYPEGSVVYILSTNKQDQEVEKIVLEAGWDLVFPAKVLKELESMEAPDIAKELSYRKDLRHLPTFTIDGADSKDLDDAISIESTKTWGYILYVHIADVAHFVRFGTALDKEAYKRSTSVYLADRVLPMLPPLLSNDLCSLHPHTDKLTLTCEMHLDTEGSVQSVNVYESVISSDRRLTYKEVDDILEHNKNTGDLLFGGTITSTLMKHLKMVNSLKKKLLEKRVKRGYLNFHFPETKIVFDEKWNVARIEKYHEYESHTLIELCMVLANESIGEKFRDIPFLYRVHEAPKSEDKEKLQELLDAFQIPFQIEEGSTREFAKLLHMVREKYPEDASFLQKAILRIMPKAIYSITHQGHFGLGLWWYSHFTSPIRRYPDLQIHRIIKNLENSENSEGSESSKGLEKYWEYVMEVKQNIISKKHLKKVAKHTTEQEIKAQELERKVRDYFVAQYYASKVGEEFDARVSGMITKGIFVELADTAEGIVLMWKTWKFNERFLSWSNALGTRTLRIGDVVRVKLLAIDMNLYRLEFGFVVSP